MLAPLATSVPSRAAYLQQLETTIAQTTRIAELPTLPWSLLALNATVYLDQYLTAAAYRAALNAAIQRANVELRSWAALSGSAPTDVELHPLIASGAERSALYRWLFDRALSSGNPAQLLLAQHACEIAEVLDDRQLLPALRLGLIAVPGNSLAAIPSPPNVLAPIPDSIEQLSRALLRYRIPARQFTEHLLLLHAARRARQLSGIAVAASSDRSPQLPAAKPKRLRIVQPHDLALRAVTSGDPLATTMIEAGLVEAEELTAGPKLLLLAALDHALDQLL